MHIPPLICPKNCIKRKRKTKHRKTDSIFDELEDICNHKSQYMKTERRWRKVKQHREWKKVKLKDPQKEILIKAVLKEKTQEFKVPGTPDGIILTHRGAWGDREIG